MFERFRSTFRFEPVEQRAEQMPEVTRDLQIPGYLELMGVAAGCSFDRGIYRLHSRLSGEVGQRCADEAFPELEGRLSVFGLDWLGRQFALDFARTDNGEPLVMMLEPGTGEALEIPVTFVQFHEQELVSFSEEALARSFFDQWLASRPASPTLALSECVGYRVPLFLGGRDEIDNLEVVDFDVYWTVSGQLRTQVVGLGNRIDGGPDAE